MRDRKHVSCLVRGDLQRSPQYELERLVIPVRIAQTMDRPDADPIAQRRLAEDIVPTLAGPEIFGRQRQIERPRRPATAA